MIEVTLGLGGRTEDLRLSSSLRVVEDTGGNAICCVALHIVEQDEAVPWVIVRELIGSCYSETVELGTETQVGIPLPATCQ